MRSLKIKLTLKEENYDQSNSNYKRIVSNGEEQQTQGIYYNPGHSNWS